MEKTPTESIALPTKEIILERLESLPKKIMHQETEIQKTSDSISEQDFQAKLIKNQAALDIFKEKDIEDKPIYKNEMHREMELSKRLSLNEYHQGIMGKMNKNMALLKEQQIYHEFLKNRFSAAKYISKLIGGE